MLFAINGFSLVGVSTVTPNSGAELHIYTDPANGKGLLVPNLVAPTAQMQVPGMVYYDTDEALFKVWNGVAWVSVSQGATGPTGDAGATGPSGIGIAQTLSTSGTNLTISSGNTVSIPGMNGEITGVTAGNGITTGSTNGTVTLHVGAGNDMDVTSTSISIEPTLDYVSNISPACKLILDSDGTPSASNSVQIGTSATDGTDLYISDRIIDLDNSTYYIDPSSRFSGVIHALNVIYNSGTLQGGDVVFVDDIVPALSDCYEIT